MAKGSDEKADKTGHNMLFHEKELELLQPEQISAHDVTAKNQGEV